MLPPPLISAITLAELSRGPCVREGRRIAPPGRPEALGPLLRPMIAAVAVANEVPLFTCNPDDFAGIDGLTVVPIRHPDAI